MTGAKLVRWVQVTLVGLWLVPAVVSVRFGFWRFVVVRARCFHALLAVACTAPVDSALIVCLAPAPHRIASGRWGCRCG